MRASWFLLGCLAVSGCPRNAPPAPANTAVPATKPEPLTSEAKEALVERVLGAQRAGFIDHDLARYMEVWSTDATLIGGRSSTPGPFDFALDRDKIEASKRLLFGGPTSPELRLEPQDVMVSGDTSEAEISWKMLHSSLAGAFLEGEHYKLRNTDAGWLVTENRFWSLASGPVGMLEEVDTSEYEVFDDKAAQETSMARVTALFGAGRYAEAYAWVQKEEPRNAQDWYFRAALAQINGDAEGARRSGCMARSLTGPSEQEPGWLKALACPE